MHNQMEIHNTENPFYTRGPFKAIVLLLAISLVVKVPLLTLKWGLIYGDSIIYVDLAKYFSQMDLKAGLSSNRYLPFYPLLIALLHGIGGSWATSAIMVSFLCSWLAIIPFYLLAARIFDEKIAFVSSFFFILSPDINFVSTTIGSDAAFMLLFILGIWFLWLAYEKGGSLYWGGFIAFAIMATLTRSAGVTLIPLFLFWLACSYRRDGKRLSKFLVVAVLCIVASAALLLFYSLYIGELPVKAYHILVALTDLSYLKMEKISTALKLAEQTAPGGRYFDFFEMARHYIYVIYMMGLVDLLIRACGYAIFPFVAIGLFWKKKGGGGYGRSYLLTIALLFIAMNYVFLIQHDSTEARYLLPAAIALFPIGGQGYMKLEGYLRERFSINSTVVAVVVGLLVVVGSAYKFNSMRKHLLAYRNLPDSIRWVKANVPPEAMIVTNYAAIAISAERTYLEVDCLDLDKCMEAAGLQESGADYIIYRTIDNTLEVSPYAPEKVFHGSRFDIYVFKAGGEDAA